MEFLLLLLVLVVLCSIIHPTDGFIIVTQQQKPSTFTRSSSSFPPAASSSSSSLSFLTQLSYRNLPPLDDNDNDNEDEVDEIKTTKKKADYDDTTTSSSSNNNNWSLEEDWILMDTISKYTIITSTSGSESSRVGTTAVTTFWEQFLSATPRLSSKYTIEELKDRLDVLQKQPKNKKKNSLLLLYGPSPQILNHWIVSSSNSNNSNQQILSGQTSEGRWIWLQPHLMGRLADDPILSSSFASNNEIICNGMAGGYVETINGRIYELGTPSSSSSSSSKMTTTTTTVDPNPKASSLEEEEEKDNSNVLSLTSSWWIPATTATISALVASCVLSACIGYGAGLSIIQDDHTYGMSSSINQPPPVVLQNRAPGPVAASTYATQPLQQDLLSPQQQKDRLEKRLQQEQTMIQMIQQKLSQDQNALQNL